MVWRTAWRALPVFNLTIGSTALWIQGALLLPWHHELDDSFARLRVQRDAEQKLALARLKTIEAKMSDLDQTFTDLRTQRNKENMHVMRTLDQIKQGVIDP
jgi:hypothetical protein